MKNLKKYLTFTNIIAIFSFIVLMLFFTPCFTFTDKQSIEPQYYRNLFQMAFGCTVPNPLTSLDPIKYGPSAGLILAFIFLMLGMVASIMKNKNRLFGFIATAFYIASGVLIACGVPLIVGSNYDTSSPMTYTIKYYGWAIAIATLVCFSGLCAFIDTMASFAKPKVQEVY